MFLFIVRREPNKRSKQALLKCSTLSYLTIFTGQRDGTGFPGNDKNLSRERRSGKNGKLQALMISELRFEDEEQKKEVV